MTDQPTTVAEMLAAARRRIRRYRPHELAGADDVIVVDTRDSADRAAEGVIPGSVWIPGNVLAWRADPASAFRDERIADYDAPVVIVCNEGYSSSMAAALLVDIGLGRAGDLVGGYRAWKAAGLPVTDSAD